MSEVMGLEHLTLLLAQTEGFLTDARVPCTAKQTKAGASKTDGTMGDLDVVGLGPQGTEPRRLLVAECKGYGAPEDYPCWLTPPYLMHIEDLVWSIATNIASVPDVRWKAEFDARNGKPTDCWIVFSGYFMPGKNNPRNWKITSTYHEDFIKNIKTKAEENWNKWKGSQASQIECDLLQDAEKYLSQKYGLRVRLLPVHLLIEELIIGISSDMTLRRKRYASPAAELIRWLVRAVRNDVLDLADIEKKLKDPTGSH